MRNQDVGPSHSYNFREIFVEKSLILTESSQVELSFTLRPRKSSTWDELCVYSHTEEIDWSEHSSGLVLVMQDKQNPNEIDGHRDVKHCSQDYTSLDSSRHMKPLAGYVQTA